MSDSVDAPRRAVKRAQRQELEREHYNREIVARWSEEAFDARFVAAKEEMLTGPRPKWDRYHYAYGLLGDIDGKRILECGCGTGLHTLLMASAGGSVSGFDVAEMAVETTVRNAGRLSMAGRVDGAVAAAEELPYRTGCFDLVVGFVALHHFDLSRALPEISRVLRPGGRAVFMEPFAGSRLLRGLRLLVPMSDRESPGGRQLRESDLAAIRCHFSQFRCKEFELLTRLTRLFFLHRLVPLLRRLDHWCLCRFPILRRFARIVVLEMRK